MLEISYGAEQVRFNLSEIYTGLNDPAIERDLREIETLTRSFKEKHKGKLKNSLGSAIEDLDRITRLENKLSVYFSLLSACDVTNQEIKRLESAVTERLARCNAESLSFFDIEVGQLSAGDYEQLLKSDPKVAFHKPMLDQTRKLASHLLTEEVERALTLRQPYGPSELYEFWRERLAQVRFAMKDSADTEPRMLSLEAMMNIITDDPDRTKRAAAIKSVNEKLESDIAPLTVQTLNAIIGLKCVETSERGYDSPMAARNLNNQVSQEVVDALHKAVSQKGAELAKRYYRLLARNLKLDKLWWSDRNASIKAKQDTVPWQQGVQIVFEAFTSFSPTLAQLFMKMIEDGHIDAPHYPTKSTGAFNMSVVMPEPIDTRTYTFMNYFGTYGDVQTLAHESGHAVHGILAGQAQGSLMQHAPIAYCETASIFAEMVTFNFLLHRTTSKSEKLALLMDKCSDFFNTVVRQISFSFLEQKLHAERKNGKISTERYKEIWLEVTKQFYGEDGEIFEYKDMDFLWSYITHFASPFYVYGYAFGEVLTQSLYAVKDSFGERFEPLYLDLLRAGGTKNASDLVAPFGLDPNKPDFWEAGMQASVERWLEEAEQLTDELP